MATPASGSISAEVLQRLEADGRHGLAPVLERLRGLSLPGGWVLSRLIGVGGQGMVWSATRAGHDDLAVKLALLGYHRPWSFGRNEICDARRRIAQEARVLSRLAEELRAADLALLPRFFGLVEAPNPLYQPARDPPSVGAEPFVVMELISGRPLLLHAKALLEEDRRATSQGALPPGCCSTPPAGRSGRPALDFCRGGAGTEGARALGRLLERAVRRLLAMQRMLATRGAVYVDFKPEHLIAGNSGEADVRLLDAGGVHLFEAGADAVRTVPLAVTPRYAGATGNGDARQRAERAARRSLAATLYEIWTGRTAASSRSSEGHAPSMPRWLRDLIGRLEADDGASWSELLALVAQ